MSSRLGQFLRIAYYNIWEFWFNSKCRWCGQRTPNLEAHFHIDHAGDEWMAR